MIIGVSPIVTGQGRRYLPDATARLPIEELAIFPLPLDLSIAGRTSFGKEESIENRRDSTR